MKKNTARWWIVFTVVLVVYHVIVFAIPFSKNGIFFMSWFFTLLAICSQIYTVRTAFYHGEGIRSKFYGFPIARISVIYLAVQLVLGMGFMAFGSVAAVPMWLPLILYVILFGASVVGFISADAMRDEIERQDVQIEKDVRNMRRLQSKAASIVQYAQDSKMREVLERFSEDLRYSDPVSSAALEGIEADLAVCMDEMQQAVIEDDREAVFVLVQKAKGILAERNRLCKLEKRSAI